MQLHCLKGNVIYTILMLSQQNWINKRAWIGSFVGDKRVGIWVRHNHTSGK